MVQRRVRVAIVVYEILSTDGSRCYRYTLDVQRMSRDAIVVHEMFNGRSEMEEVKIRALENYEKRKAEMEAKEWTSSYVHIDATNSYSISSVRK
ncbi:hypothetical protein Tco_1504259 [Tanacetum coccineum]